MEARGKPTELRWKTICRCYNPPLFCRGLTAEELQTLLSELGACVRSYGKWRGAVLAGAPSRRVGVVLTGSIEAYRPAPGGARIPITHMGPGGVFGDVLGGSSLDSPVTVVASAPCEALLFPYEQLLLPDGSTAHQRLLQNLVRTISDKYFPALPPGGPAGAEDPAGQGVRLSAQRGRAGGQPDLHHPLLPHPAGRLPQL